MSRERGARTYRVRHLTEYSYDEPVTLSYGRAHVSPRNVPGQWSRRVTVDVDPGADLVTEHQDYYGNRSVYFEVHTPHTRLAVTTTSLVEVTRAVPDLERASGWTWEAAAAAARADPELALVRGLALPSRHVTMEPGVRRFAASFFPPGRPVTEAVLDVVHSIHDGFAYRSGATTVATTLPEVIANREGVCQDFAHLGVACLRVAGLHAAYVSGYLETSPPPGQPRLEGADASHAWLSVWLPGIGWLDLDPTNDQPADLSYVVVARGRDYADVPPLKGVIYTTSSTSTLRVAVDVTRYAAGAAHDPGTLTAVEPPAPGAPATEPTAPEPTAPEPPATGAGPAGEDGARAQPG